MANTVRGAFGQSASIGTLFDAKTDGFLPTSILRGKLPSDAVSEQLCPKTDVSISYDGTYLSRFGSLDVRPEQAANILAGLLVPSGSAAYLQETLDTEEALHGALYYKVTTMQQRLSFKSVELQELIDLAPLQAQSCTHVVTGIDWGLQSIIATKHLLSSDDQRSKVQNVFRSDLDRLKATIESAETLTKVGNIAMDQPELHQTFTLYTDALADKGLILHNLSEVYSFIQLVPDHISKEGGGKGWPISYTMLPLGMLQYLIPTAGEIDTPLTIISPEYLTKFIQLFDEFAACKQKLKIYHAFLVSHEQHVADDHILAVVTSINLLQQSKQVTKAELGKILADVRSDILKTRSLWELFNRTISTDQSPLQISAIAGQEKEKLEFLSMAVAKGAVYLGYNGMGIRRATRSNRHISSYIFMFNQAAMKESKAWNENCALLMELLNQKDPATVVYVADCDAPSTHAELQGVRISQYHQGQEVVTDLADQRQFMAGKCFAQYNEKTLDNASNKPKPVTRRFVRIPCPGSSCDRSQTCEWICSRCFAPIECGFTDKYIYCDCGRSPYSAYEFKCNGEDHGAGFETYDKHELYGLLQQLDQSDYLNILILGETGVGKSTFINAFVMDRENTGQEIQEKHIRVGSRDDEADGAKGASATQQTTVYPVTIGSTTYRLIDTPGIGDTRGLSFDKANMADILRTLSSYENLHGILILLKSNNARLNTTFRFCIKELLAHLHRGAAQNMAFGFTNTRISNYTPGDTFGPLKSLLQEHSEIGLALSTPTTYCFDSESFRYLAAYKNGIPLPNEEDFRRSWEHSSKEAHRLLNHFEDKPPHNVKSTLNLNGARQLIIELTKPMAKISQLIRDNIVMFEDRMQQLQDTRLTADSLRKKLHLEKIQFNSKQLSKPQTVCKISSCYDFKDSGKGDGEVVTIYKTHCHPVCHLTDVKQDVIAAPGLIHCYAFKGKNTCKVCSHHWQEHLHVLYELKEVRVQVKDTEIERQLRANADDLTLRQAGIRDINLLIDEFKLEHKEIQEATARFSLFLQKYAMTPINDATVDYVDMLIQDEEAKINAGRQVGISVDMNLKRIKSLQEDKKAHIELVQTLTQNMRAPRGSADQVLDEKGVSDLVGRLYNLKHFGKNLKSVKNTITSAHQATYRERPYRVQRPGWRGGRITNPDSWANMRAGRRQSHPWHGSAITTRKASGIYQGGRKQNQSRGGGLIGMISSLLLR